MSELIVMTFDTAEEAGQVRDSLKDIQKAGRLALDDYAIISKDAGGKVHVRNVPDTGMKWGALGGAILGPVLLFMFPVVGIAVGATVGALVGKTLDMGVDKKFVKEVTGKLQPNGSALFLIVRSGDPNAVLSALRPYKGHLLQTTLSPELEEELKKSLQ